MNEIYAFIGFSGSGKDYESNKILEFNTSAKRIGFSDGVRQETFKRFNMHPEYGEVYERWKSSYVIDIDGVKHTGRDLLILVGETLRKQDNYVWANKWYETASKLKPKIITVNDCRFDTEIDAVLQFAKNFNYKVKFIYCAYQSNRLTITKGDTDIIAYNFINCKHLENITDKIIAMFFGNVSQLFVSKNYFIPTNNC